MYHALFKGQRDLNPDILKAKVTELAKSAGLDEAKFTQCYDGKTALPRVEKDLTEAAAVGANSTPTFFINGHRLEGGAAARELQGHHRPGARLMAPS